MTIDPSIYDFAYVVKEEGLFPSIEVNGIKFLDTPQQRMIIIRELEAQNKKLETENKTNLEACMEYKQRFKEEKEQASYFYHIADDLYNKLREIQKGINIDVVEKLEDEKQELLKQIAELQQTCTEMAVKMHNAINAYEILKQKTGYTDDNNKKESTEEAEKESEEKTE